MSETNKSRDDVRPVVLLYGVLALLGGVGFIVLGSVRHGLALRYVGVGFLTIGMAAVVFGLNLRRDKKYQHEERWIG